MSGHRDRRGMRAISIRQPWAEKIFRGDKPAEYRKCACRILHERVYVYAAPKVTSAEREEFRRMGAKPGDFPTRVLVGTIEFESCSGAPGSYSWKIKNPQRLDQPVAPTGRPGQIWFYPFVEES